MTWKHFSTKTLLSIGVFVLGLGSWTFGQATQEVKKSGANETKTKLPVVKDSASEVANEINEIRKALGGGVGSALEGVLSEKESEKLFREVLQEMAKQEKTESSNSGLTVPNDSFGAVMVQPRPKSRSRLRPPAGAEKWSKGNNSASQKGGWEGIEPESGSMEASLKGAEERLSKLKKDLAVYRVRSQQMEKQIVALKQSMQRQAGAVEKLQKMIKSVGEEGVREIGGKTFTKAEIADNITQRLRELASIKNEIVATASRRDLLESRAAIMRRDSVQQIAFIERIKSIIDSRDREAIRQAENMAKAAQDSVVVPSATVIAGSVGMEPVDPQPQSTRQADQAVDGQPEASRGEVGEEMTAREISAQESVQEPVQAAVSSRKQNSLQRVQWDSRTKAMALRNAARKLEQVAADLEDAEEFDSADELWSKARSLRKKARTLKED